MKTFVPRLLAKWLFEVCSGGDQDAESQPVQLHIEQAGEGSECRIADVILASEVQMRRNLPLG